MSGVISLFLLLILMLPPTVFSGELDQHIENLALPETSERTPVSVVVSVYPNVVNVGDAATVVIKVHIHPRWRIYRFVGPSSPYKTVEWVLELPKGAQRIGFWQKPQPEYLAGYSDILIYQGEQIFTHQLVVADDAQGELSLLAGLVYQACNEDMCLRPIIKTTEVTMTVK